MKFKEYRGFWNIDDENEHFPEQPFGELRHYNKTGALFLTLTFKRPSSAGHIKAKSVRRLNMAYSRINDRFYVLRDLELHTGHSDSMDEAHMLVTVVYKVKSLLVLSPHFSQITTIFDGIEFESDLIKHWLPAVEAREEGVLRDRFIEIPDWEFREFKINEHNLSIYISYGLNKRIENEHIWENEFLLEKGYRFSIKFDEPQELDKCLEIVKIFEGFFYLITGLRVKLGVKLTASVEVNGVNTNSEGNYYIWDDRIKKTYYSRRTVLTGFDKIESIFTQVVSVWLRDWSKLSPLLESMETLSWSTGVKLRTAFLNMIQVIESLHDRLYDRSIIGRRSFKNITSVLSEHIERIEPKELRDSINERISYSYLKTLRQKLEFLITDEFIEIFDTGITKAELIDKITVTRNYYTHLNDSYRSRILTAHGHRRTIAILQCAIVFHIVRHLGLDDRSILDVIKHSELYKSDSGDVRLYWRDSDGDVVI